jgi:hypothetical protein
MLGIEIRGIPPSFVAGSARTALPAIGPRGGEKMRFYLTN